MNNNVFLVLESRSNGGYYCLIRDNTHFFQHQNTFRAPPFLAEKRCRLFSSFYRCSAAGRQDKGEGEGINENPGMP